MNSTGPLEGPVLFAQIHITTLAIADNRWDSESIVGYLTFFQGFSRSLGQILLVPLSKTGSMNAAQAHRFGRHVLVAGVRAGQSRQGVAR